MTSPVQDAIRKHDAQSEHVEDRECVYRVLPETAESRAPLFDMARSTNLATSGHAQILIAQRYGLKLPNQYDLLTDNEIKQRITDIIHHSAHGSPDGSWHGQRVVTGGLIRTVKPSSS